MMSAELHLGIIAGAPLLSTLLPRAVVEAFASYPQKPEPGSTCGGQNCWLATERIFHSDSSI